MIKRKVIICCALLGALGLNSCGDAKESTTAKSVDNTELTTAELNTSESSDVISTENDHKTALNDSKYFRVPLKNIYMNVPDYHEIEEGITELYMVHSSRYVAITGSVLLKATSCDEAHEVCIKEMKANMMNYQGGMNEFKIERKEKVVINGIEMLRMEGCINYGEDTPYDGYAVGYAFILDDSPCEIIGSVIDKEQSESLKEEIKTVVDEMAKTVRTAP